MTDFLVTLALRGAGLTSVGGPELLAPRLPARFEPVAGIALLDEVRLTPEPDEVAAPPDGASLAVPSPPAQGSGLSPPIDRASQPPPHLEKVDEPRPDAGGVASWPLDAPRRRSHSSAGVGSPRPGPVGGMPDAAVSRSEPAHPVSSNVPGHAPSEVDPVVLAHGASSITAAPAYSETARALPAANPGVEHGVPVETHAVPPRARALPSARPWIEEPGERRESMPGTSGLVPPAAFARSREVVAPVTVTIGRIEIQIAASPVPAREPIPRTRGFDAYTQARRGYRR